MAGKSLRLSACRYLAQHRPRREHPSRWAVASDESDLHRRAQLRPLLLTGLSFYQLARSGIALLVRSGLPGPPTLAHGKGDVPAELAVPTRLVL